MPIKAKPGIDMSLPASLPSVSIRHHLLPADIGYITYLHAVLYAPQQGWDHTFDSYVAIPLAEFAMRHSPQERIWIVESNGRIMGCVAIVKFSLSKRFSTALVWCKGYWHFV